MSQDVHQFQFAARLQHAEMKSTSAIMGKTVFSDRSHDIESRCLRISSAISTLTAASHQNLTKIDMIILLDELQAAE